MSAAKEQSVREQLPRRVLLLLTPRTYRAESFFAAAARLGIEVVKAIDMDPALAAHWNYPLGLDYSKPEESAEKIVAFAKDSPLGAILSVDDSGTIIAALASDSLNLPHNAPDAALAARDKHIMRQRLQEAGIPAPRAKKVVLQPGHAEAQLQVLADETDYPCVVKPLNLSGSRGVIRADDPEQFDAAARRLMNIISDNEPHSEVITFLIESFVPGVEVAVEAIMKDGRFQLLALFDKPDPLNGPYFEETIYVTPSRLPTSDQAAIEKCAFDAALALGLREGPVHAEMRLNSDGPWIIELAGRSIGGLCSHTLRFSGETSLEELILRQAFGLEIQGLQRDQRAGGVMMIPIPEMGLLKAVHGCEEAAGVPLIESVEITARANYVLKPLPEGDSYLGFIFAFGDNADEVEAALRTAHSKLSFDIAPLLPLL